MSVKSVSSKQKGPLRGSKPDFGIMKFVILMEFWLLMRILVIVKCMWMKIFGRIQGCTEWSSWWKVTWSWWGNKIWQRCSNKVCRGRKALKSPKYCLILWISCPIRFHERWNPSWASNTTKYNLFWLNSWINRMIRKRDDFASEHWLNLDISRY